MTDAITIEELIQLKQEGKIGWCELALRSEHGKAPSHLLGLSVPM